MPSSHRQYHVSSRFLPSCSAGGVTMTSSKATRSVIVPSCLPVGNTKTSLLASATTSSSPVSSCRNTTASSSGLQPPTHAVAKIRVCAPLPREPSVSRPPTSESRGHHTNDNHYNGGGYQHHVHASSHHATSVPHALPHHNPYGDDTQDEEMRDDSDFRIAASHAWPSPSLSSSVAGVSGIASATGERAALLIGINYTSVPGHTLGGCENDMVTWQSQILPNMAPCAKIRVLEDNSAPSGPTYAAMTNALVWLAAQPEPTRLFVYSGHGATLSRTSQGIVPIDYDKKGLISDAKLYEILVRGSLTDAGRKLIAVFDCCHSGSMLGSHGQGTNLMFNLPYHYSVPASSVVATSTNGSSYYTGRAVSSSSSCTAEHGSSSSATAVVAPDVASHKTSTSTTLTTLLRRFVPRVQMTTKKKARDVGNGINIPFILAISACREDETDADETVNHLACGALTEAFYYVATQHEWKLTYRALLLGIWNRFRMLKLTQSPQMECSIALDLDSVINW